MFAVGAVSNGVHSQREPSEKLEVISNMVENCHPDRIEESFKIGTRLSVY